MCIRDSSWCERVDGRQYSCVSVAAKGDLLLQMYSVANTLNDAKVTLGRFLGLSAACLLYTSRCV